MELFLERKNDLLMIGIQKRERERKKGLRISLFTWNDMEVQKIKKEYLNKKKGAQEKVKQKTLMNKSWKTFEESKWEN